MTDSPEPQGQRLAGHRPSPLPGEDGPDRAPKPVRPGRSGRMARRAGSRAQPEHLRAPSQWVGWPAFLSPTQAAGYPHLSQGLWARCGVLEFMPCWAGGEGCVPQGRTEFQAWGAPAQPCMHPQAAPGLAPGCGPHPGGRGMGDAGPLSPSQPAPRARASPDRRPFIERGRGSEAGPRGCPSSHRQTPGSGTPLSTAGSEVIKVDTTGRFLTFEARVDEGLSGAPPPDPRPRAASLRIRVW